MGKKNKGHENLIPFSERSKEEAREKGRKGGIASGKTRREKANMRKLLETFLDSKIEGKDITYAERITLSMLNIAANPKQGGAAVRAYIEILKTIGQYEAVAGVEEEISDDTRKAVEDLLNADTNERESDQST